MTTTKKSNESTIKNNEPIARFLERKGHTILLREYKCAAGEIDFITKDEDGIIHFIETSLRYSTQNGFEDALVSKKKRRRLESLVETFLSEYDGEEASITLDYIQLNVLANGRAFLKIYRNILSREDAA